MDRNLDGIDKEPRKKENFCCNQGPRIEAHGYMGLDACTLHTYACQYWYVPVIPIWKEKKALEILPLLVGSLLVLTLSCILLLPLAFAAPAPPPPPATSSKSSPPNSAANSSSLDTSSMVNAGVDSSDSDPWKLSLKVCESLLRSPESPLLRGGGAARDVEELLASTGEGDEETMAEAEEEALMVNLSSRRRRRR